MNMKNESENKQNNSVHWTFKTHCVLHAMVVEIKYFKFWTFEL